MTASPPELTPTPPPADDTPFERVTDATRHEALAVLLTGRRQPDDAAVRPFLDFARDNQLDISRFWIARDGPRTAAAVLIVPGVGRTAMLFLSPIASNGRVGLAGRLIAHAVARLDPPAVRLVQALLEQGQARQRQTLEAGGFKFLADLAYMHRPGKALPQLPPVTLDGRELAATHWSEDARPLFSAAIADSYQDTRDCPGLLGLRDMDDIIAGHMATGTFNPAHWTVWSDGGKPAAVLLLAESSAEMGFELVYIGVAPDARGRGLSRTVMQHALHTTAVGVSADSARGGHARLHLAVDDRNEPALKLYRGLGFRTSVRKTALIYTPAPGNAPGIPPA